MPHPPPRHVVHEGLTDTVPSNSRHPGPAGWAHIQHTVSPDRADADVKVLANVKRRADQLDNAFKFCGIRIGWSSVIAIVPGIGDMLDMLLALMVIRTACNAGLPASIKFQMLCNVAFDFLIGLVPLIGDLMDIGFKANSRNANLLESHLLERRATAQAFAPSIWNDASLARPFVLPARHLNDASSLRPGIQTRVEAQRPPPRTGVWNSTSENLARQQTARR